MELQLFAQTWKDDNVTVFEQKDGTIPDKLNQLILKDIMENSKVMQLAKYEEMTSKEKKFEYFAKGPGAYWVSEGEKINTSKPQWLTAKLVAKKLAESGKYDAVICLGAVIRGATTHYDYVCNEVSKGVAQAGMQTGAPVIFSVVTTENIQQAVERAGTKAGNKGADGAMAAMEMANLLPKL